MAITAALTVLTWIGVAVAADSATSAASSGDAPPGEADFVVPAWAYPTTSPAVAVAGTTDDTVPLHVPDSQATYTRAQLKDLFATPDWHPDDHAAMPGIVAHGRKPDVYACAYCHLPDGSGRPENAPVAGLPAAYIVQQVRDMASHRRRSAWNGSYLPSDLMNKLAGNATEAEIATAATYFSTLRMPRKVDVVETNRVPAMSAAGWLYVPIADAGDEPLGERLVEVARDQERHELRDSANGSIAYVPPGSVARGRIIVTTGANGRAVPCASCHGTDLRGVGLIPPIAGRSPTYILRQLLAFRSGARSAPAGLPMQQLVAHVELNDMVAIAAYLGTLPP